MESKQLIKKRSFIPRIFSLATLMWLLGFLYPVAALVVEVFFHLSAQAFINPIPTWFHTLLIALVASVNLYAGISCIRRRGRWLPLTCAMLGFSIVVSLVYSVVYLPVWPILITYLAISIFAFLLPLILLALPFSPCFALAASWYYLCQLIKHNPAERALKQYAVVGAVFGILAITVAEIPRTVARIGLERMMVDSSDSNMLNTMRLLASREVLLKKAYEMTGSLSSLGYRNISTDIDFIGWLTGMASTQLFSRQFNPETTSDRPPSAADAQRVYFQVTGSPYNSKPPPASAIMQASLFWGRSFDPDLGGTQTGGKTAGVSLVTSQFDSSIDADAALSYSEWIMEFRNDSTSQQEARAEIALPAGAVVSRVTLWINGEEREASFDQKSKVRAAYEKIVRRRRDPLLVTSSGKNRILVQCFPIESNGGKMKIRLGMSTPLPVESPRLAHFLFPGFSEHNFSIDKNVRHKIWLESSAPLQASDENLMSEHPNASLYALRGDIDAANQALAQTSVNVLREPRMISWTKDSLSDSIISQDISLVPMPATKNLILVIDGSARMKSHIYQIAAAIEKLRPGFGVAAFIAGDRPIVVTPRVETSDEVLLQKIAQELRTHNYVGGTDNALTLSVAWDLAATNPDSSIVWLHGPQPAEFNEISEFNRRYNRRNQHQRIISIATSPEVNRIATATEEIGLIDEMPANAIANLWDTLSKLLAGGDRYQARRQVIASPDLLPETAHRTSQHLARLWANDNVIDLASQQKQVEAAVLAAKYSLVTEHSGAVVLESLQEYQAANLNAPPTAGKVPTVPEPEIYMTMFLSLIVLLGLKGWRKNASRL